MTARQLHQRFGFPISNLQSHISIALAPVAVVILCAAALVISGCERNNTDSGDVTTSKSYAVVATTAMIADIVRNVAGDRAKLQTLMGPGVDPHLYRPTRSDVAALLAADIIFYNGLNLEGKMSDTFVRVARSGKPVFAVTELIDEEYLIAPAPPEGAEGHHDPHVWMDPNGWIKATEAVIASLIEFDSSNAQTYRENGDRYIAELRKLDEYARQRLATIPSQRRVLVTAHDAFSYFARAYGLEVQSILGISTDSEAGLRQIESMVDMLVSRKIPAVFTESSVSDKDVRALIEGAKARSHAVQVGGELFSDAMGTPGAYEGTYIGMIDHNITTIARALGGEAPQRGMNGELTESNGTADERR